ncbi:DUF4349 domain-containing protein [Changchengzhania lutea]|uniref:DUF4349 domain-containing protein n=1 Tax=Changchengzhania lutea TaxID=2049305 RepID=UPI00115F3045|nr:DUF4349 domain-containing protein [Changchengzhania lutea]
MRYLLSLFLLIIPLACSTNSNNPQSDSEAYDYTVGEAQEKDASTINGLISSPSETIEQKIIKESFLRFETQDLENTYKHIKRIIIQNNGFIQDDRSNKSYNTITRHLIIRIPTTNFQTTVDSISHHVAYFDTKRTSSKDVTEEFIDIEVRLKAKQTLEKRYLELLSKANNVKEILEIEKELSNIREAIEAKQGRLKYLQNKVSLSTLDIEFYKRSAESGVTVSYGVKMWNAVKSGFNGLSIFFLGLLHIWPFIIILILLFFIIKRWLKKRHKK